jgi:hypothetical protein
MSSPQRVVRKLEIEDSAKLIYERKKVMGFKRIIIFAS